LKKIIKKKEIFRKLIEKIKMNFKQENENPREKPYHLTQSTWKSILSNSNIIPMNQRNYNWDIEPQIIKFLNDLFHIFEQTSYYEKMGTIIYYTGNKDGREVWDGQQRLITIILIVKAISYISSLQDNETATNFSKSVINCIKEDIDSMIEISTHIKEFNKKYPSFNVIPKVYCINPHDNEALANIYNTYKPLISYYSLNKTDEDKEENEYKDEDEDDKDDDEEEEYNNIDYTEEYEEIDNTKYYSIKYVCNKCKKTINANPIDLKNRERDFVRHLVKCINYDDKNYKNKNTNIYKTYEFICKTLHQKKYDIKKLKELYQFILNYIDLGVYECSNLDYVSKIFEWENNRGKPVESLDVIKNNILANIPCNYKLEIYDKWNEKKNKNNIYNNYGQKILN